eukprot:g76766.t1
MAGFQQRPSLTSPRPEIFFPQLSVGTVTALIILSEELWPLAFQSSWYGLSNGVICNIVSSMDRERKNIRRISEVCLVILPADSGQNVYLIDLAGLFEIMAA